MCNATKDSCDTRYNPSIDPPSAERRDWARLPEVQSGTRRRRSATICNAVELQYMTTEPLKGVAAMAASALVQTRIDPVLKERAAAVLENMGLTVSDVVRILLTRVANEGALPFP